MASVCSSFPPSPLFLAAWCRDRKSFMCLERASRTLHPFPRDQGVVPWILLTFLEDRSDICSLPVLRNYPIASTFQRLWSGLVVMLARSLSTHRIPSSLKPPAPGIPTSSPLQVLAGPSQDQTRSTEQLPERLQ